MAPVRLATRRAVARDELLKFSRLASQIYILPAILSDKLTNDKKSKLITMNNLGNALARNAHLENYLGQLSEMVGHEVTEDQLSSLEEIERLKEASRELQRCPKKIIEITPEDLRRERFALLVLTLAKAKSSPVSIWLDATSYCGTLYLAGVNEFNFSFRLDSIPEGVVVLLTEDGRDQLLLDFSPEEVAMELQGKAWGNVEY